MKKYILIQTNLFNALMKNQLKGYVYTNGKFIQDSESTLASVALNDPPPTRYYILSWSGDNSSSVPSQYNENRDNPKTNKIFTEDELVAYLIENMEIE